MLLPVTFIIAGEGNGKIRPHIKRLANKIGNSKRLITGPVGFSATHTKQFDWYLDLADQATADELALLTDHRSAKMRACAFELLAGKYKTGLTAIMEKHIADSASFISMSGCVVMTERVNVSFLWCLQRLAGDPACPEITEAWLAEMEKRIKGGK